MPNFDFSEKGLVGNNLSGTKLSTIFCARFFKKNGSVIFYSLTKFHCLIVNLNYVPNGGGSMVHGQVFFKRRLALFLFKSFKVYHFYI